MRLFNLKVHIVLCIAKEKGKTRKYAIRTIINFCLAKRVFILLAVVMFVTGPLTGVLSDRLVSRHGRRRPIMFAGALVLL